MTTERDRVLSAEKSVPVDKSGHSERRPTCEGCGNEIDPDTCGCGDSITHDAMGAGHAPVAMGCDCYRENCGASTELYKALRRLVAEFDDMDEHRPLHAGCVQCTEGATPDRYNTGPCAYHSARAALSRARGEVQS